MDKKHEVFLEKFKAAHTLRTEKKIWHDSEIDEKLKERLKDIKIAEKINDLEIEAKVAWKFRESRKMINAQKKVLENKIQAEMLRLKVRQGLERQEKKILRTDKPKRPKLDPLPYLSKRNKSFIDSDDRNEDDLVEVTPFKKKTDFKIERGLGSTPSPLKKIKFIHRRNISPDLIRIRL